MFEFTYLVVWDLVIVKEENYLAINPVIFYELWSKAYKF